MLVELHSREAAQLNSTTVYTTAQLSFFGEVGEQFFVSTAGQFKICSEAAVARCGGRDPTPTFFYNCSTLSKSIITPLIVRCIISNRM